MTVDSVFVFKSIDATKIINQVISPQDSFQK